MVLFILKEVKKQKMMIKKIFFIAILGISANTMLAQETSINLLKAIAEYNLNEYDSAIYYANKINTAENIKKAIQIKADSYFKLKKFDKALDNYLKLTTQTDKNAINIARIYALKKDYKNAGFWLKQHLNSKYKINPGIIKTDTCFSNFSNTKQWQNIWLKDWYTPLEEKLFEVEYFRYKKKYVEALESADEIIKQHKNCYRAYAEYAKIYEKLNDWSNVVYSWKNANKYNPDNSTYIIEYGKALLHNGKFKKALQEFEKAGKIDKYRPEIYYYLALAYFRQNRFEDAVKQIEIYRKLSPNDSKAIWLAGNIYKDKGDYEKAVDVFNQGIKSGKIIKGYYVGKGEALYELERYGEAATAFTMELDLTPRNPYLYFMRGLAQIARDNKTDACKDWKHASKLGYFQADDYISKYCSN